MERSEFSENGRKCLVDISGGSAFLPPILPPEFGISATILRAADAARGAVSELTGSARVSEGLDDSVMLFRPLAMNEAVSTARIEGIHTQIVDLLIDEISPPVRPEGPRTDREMRTTEARNAGETVQLGYEWMTEGRQFGLPMIKDLHGRILDSARGSERNPGEFRKRQVWLGRQGESLAEASYVPPPPEHVLPLLENLAEFLTGPPTFGTLIDSAVGHYQFEAIHPFEDGNGRLGRALIPLHLMHHRVLDRPWLALSSALASRRDEYLSRLKRVSTDQDWDGWILFFLEAASDQARDSQRRIQKIFELRAGYRARVAEMRSPVPLRGLDFVLRRIFVSVGDIAASTGTTYPTAKAAVDEYVRAGILQPWGKLRARQYWHAAEFLADVYESEFLFGA